MRNTLVRFGLAAGIVLALGSAESSASALRVIPPDALWAFATATPAAMCGFSCRTGGRYIPGPPSVCYEEGLNYCGPSRGYGGPPPWARRGFYGPPRRYYDEPDFYRPRQRYYAWPYP